MADISAEVKKFREAIYGEEVREGFISLGEKVNAETEKATKLAQDTSKKVEGFNQRIEQNKNDIAALRRDHNADMESAKQDSAPPIITAAKGKRIQVQDSAERRIQGLRVFGKSTQVKTNGYQLFDASKIPTKTAGGATVTNNGDGSFTVSGSGQLSDTYENHLLLSNEETKKLLKAGTLKLKAERNVNPAFMAGLCPEDRNSFLPSKRLDVISNSFEITEDDLQTSRLRIVFYGNNGDSVTPGTIKPMLYQDGDGILEPYSGGEPSPSPDYPQEIKSAGDSGEIEAGIYGRNLFNVAGIKSKTQNGVTVTIHDDQSFTITGSGSVSFSSSLLIPHEEFVRMFRAGGLKMNAINLNGAELPSPKPYFALYRSTESRPEQIGTTLYHGTAYDIKQEHLEDETVYAEIGLYAWSGFTTVEGTFKAMLYQDGDGTWEPYKPVQSLTLKTPNGLPGIPVSSGGNYTDSTGQQWICDEIDLERGKYVKRVGIIESYTNEQINNTFMSTTGGLTPGAKVIYALDSPTETDLTPEEIEAYRKLHTNYPSTVVTNDVGAGMELSYVADTKNFILGQIAEITKKQLATDALILERAV